MGNYLLLPEQEGRDSKLLAWFDKWKPFYNDFGDEHKFEDIFGCVSGQSYEVTEEYHNARVDYVFRFCGTKQEVLKDLAEYAYRMVKERPREHLTNKKDPLTEPEDSDQ